MSFRYAKTLGPILLLKNRKCFREGSWSLGIESFQKGVSDFSVDENPFEKALGHCELSHFKK